MVIVTMPTVLAPTWLHVIDSLQLNFIHVSPSMPTIIWTWVDPPRGCKRARVGAHVIDSLELNGRPPVGFASCFFLLMFFPGKPINPLALFSSTTAAGEEERSTSALTDQQSSDHPPFKNLNYSITVSSVICIHMVQ